MLVYLVGSKSCWYILLVGNKQTLETIPAEKGIDVRAELLKFHQAHYSSNVMALSVLGKGKLDETHKLIKCSESVYFVNCIK